MSKGMNKVFLLGNVGKDPEIRTTQSGMVIAQFSLATPDRVKNSRGDYEDRPEWHNIVCFDRTAEVVRDYVKKGTQLLIEGKIKQESWDDKKTGEKRYMTKINCYDLTLLGSPDGAKGRADQGSSRTGQTKEREQTDYGRGNTASSGYASDYTNDQITDDDIPF